MDDGLHIAKLSLQAASYMRSVMRTIAQCHAAGILHRDVKPGNFMLQDTGPTSPIKAIGESYLSQPSRTPVGGLKCSSLLLCAQLLPVNTARQLMLSLNADSEVRDLLSTPGFINHVDPQSLT
jgi:serine/threonine protein kinase